MNEPHENRADLPGIPALPQMPINQELVGYRRWRNAQAHQDVRLPSPIRVLVDGRPVSLTHCRGGVWLGFDGDHSLVAVPGGLGGVRTDDDLMSYLRFLALQTLPIGYVGDDAAADVIRLRAELLHVESMPDRDGRLFVEDTADRIARELLQLARIEYDRECKVRELDPRPARADLGSVELHRGDGLWVAHVGDDQGPLASYGFDLDGKVVCRDWRRVDGEPQCCGCLEMDVRG